MFTPTHRHADGGLYEHLGPQKGRSYTGTNTWEDGVAYRNEEGMLFWTNDDRWAHRFEEIQPAGSRDVMVWDDENNSVAAFRFSLVEATDVYYLITKASPGRGTAISQEFIGWMKRVLKMQAEMVEQNLHIRDHDFPDLIGDVNAFHAKFGQEYIGKPRQLPEDLHDFRIKFHDEEASEYVEEYARLGDAIIRKDRRDIITAMEKQLDSLVDLVWVALGTADLQFGRHAFIEAWRRVVKANMAKVLATSDPDAEDSGRELKYDIRKPAGWLPPDHRDLVEDNAIFDDLFGRADAEDVETNTFNQEV
jgi:predicted HAD superfamily Cof-like phosphohydrolase